MIGSIIWIVMTFDFQQLSLPFSKKFPGVLFALNVFIGTAFGKNGGSAKCP